MGIIDRLRRTSAAPTEAAPSEAGGQSAPSFETGELLDLVRSTYGDETAERMLSLTIDETRRFMLVTSQHSPGTFEARYSPARTFPFSVTHDFSCIERQDDGALRLFGCSVSVQQAYSANVRDDEVPLSALVLANAQQPGRALGASIDEPQRVHPTNDGLVLDQRAARWMGIQLKAAADLVTVWNELITEWWTSDERAFCLARLDEWEAALESAELEEWEQKLIDELAGEQAAFKTLAEAFDSRPSFRDEVIAKVAHRR